MRIFRLMLWLTAMFIVCYWMSVFAGVFPVEESVPGYKAWFMSFPLADAYVAVCALVSALNIDRRPRLSALFGSMAGSGLLFLGLYALAYGHVTGLLYVPSVEESVEIAIKLYCLSAGGFFIHRSWRMLNI
jgi:hypothetical protein